MTPQRHFRIAANDQAKRIDIGNPQLSGHSAGDAAVNVGPSQLKFPNLPHVPDDAL
ncbi:hypothetical protein AB0L88_16230 [Saccharopolyspora shandongensis]|uniref:Uncharacterized protein n=1 Tax=Saccharopolyspora shandongensis TaxID=418495 RepID=A0A1H2S1E6_9PSEU|nr:hypothetical protein [Saccharopolyspora shandongensis]SDW25522.1 hypothetical protein SAMN05216215_100278 [Saccharopolyspora shandongensis]